MFNFTKQGFVVIVLLLAIVSCNKPSTVTVNIQQQSPGQTAIVSSGVVVLLLNTSNSNDFKTTISSSAGVASFSEVSSGNYKVSSEVWDGSKGLADSVVIEAKNGKSVNVNLLLR